MNREITGWLVMVYIFDEAFRAAVSKTNSGRGEGLGRAAKCLLSLSKKGRVRGVGFGIMTRLIVVSFAGGRGEDMSAREMELRFGGL